MRAQPRGRADDRAARARHDGRAATRGGRDDDGGGGGARAAAARAATRLLRGVGPLRVAFALASLQGVLEGVAHDPAAELARRLRDALRDELAIVQQHRQQPQQEPQPHEPNVNGGGGTGKSAPDAGLQSSTTAHVEGAVENAGSRDTVSEASG